MKIVIPTAGLGTRLRPHTWSKPKPLVSAAGKPVLGHVLDMFGDLSQIDEAVFIIGYLGEQIKDYVGSAYPDLNARYVIQQEMLGQSHAIWLARAGLEGPMVMAFVDTLIEADLSGLDKEQADAVAWVKEVDDPRRSGVASVGEDGWVTRIVEKPQDMSNNLAVVGFYYFKQAERLIAAIEAQMEGGEKLGGEYYLADAINIMLEDGLRMRVEPVEVWEDCGKPGPLLDTNRYLLQHGRDNSNEAERAGVEIVPPVYIAPSAQVSDSSIGPHVSIGEDCVVEGSQLRDSIIEAGTTLSSVELERSVIGRDVRMEGAKGKFNVGDSSEIEVP